MCDTVDLSQHSTACKFYLRFQAGLDHIKLMISLVVTEHFQYTKSVVEIKGDETTKLAERSGDDLVAIRIIEGNRVDDVPMPFKSK